MKNRKSVKNYGYILGIFFIAISIIFKIMSYYVNKNAESRYENTEQLQDSTTLAELWKFEFDSAANDMQIVTLRSFDKDTLQTATVVNFLNQQYPEVKLEYIKTTADTVFTKIPDSDYLSQHMGSAGADFYLKSATYLLTDLKGINYASFDFPEGDHAVPGVYKRQDWE